MLILSHTYELQLLLEKEIEKIREEQRRCIYRIENKSIVPAYKVKIKKKKTKKQIRTNKSYYIYIYEGKLKMRLPSVKRRI